MPETERYGFLPKLFNLSYGQVNKLHTNSSLRHSGDFFPEFRWNSSGIRTICLNSEDHFILVIQSFFENFSYF
jgi:hypothetical protein